MNENKILLTHKNQINKLRNLNYIETLRKKIPIQDKIHMK